MSGASGSFCLEKAWASMASAGREDQQMMLGQGEKLRFAEQLASVQISRRMQSKTWQRRGGEPCGWSF